MTPRPLSPSWAYVHDLLTKYPNTPSLTLAKKIMSENGSMFTTVEAARSAIRYFRGATGTKARKNVDPKWHRPAYVKRRQNVKESVLVMRTAVLV